MIKRLTVSTLSREIKQAQDRAMHAGSADMFDILAVTDCDI